MRIVERRHVFDERLLEIEIVGVMNALQPGRQSVQVESDDVSLPFVRGVVLREHARELNEVRITLVGSERVLCDRRRDRGRQKHRGKHDSAHDRPPW